MAYNVHRPHRALALTPPDATRPAPAVVADELKVNRGDRLGVVREYMSIRHNQVSAPYSHLIAVSRVIFNS